MKTNPTFVVRNNGKLTKTKKVDAIKVIERFMALHPKNIVKINSVLYNLAVKQYNTTVQNTSIRPTIPLWFCGKVDAVTGELIPTTNDVLARVTKGYSTVEGVLVPDAPVVELGQYIGDECLIFGTPGSIEYAQCQQGGTTAEENIEVSGVDWLASMGTSTEAGEGGGGGSGDGGLSTPDTSRTETVKLSVSDISESNVYFDWVSIPDTWTASCSQDGCMAWVGMWDANNIGGKFDWIRIGGASQKDFKNIYDGYWAGNIPKSGDKVYFMWTACAVNERSTLAVATWP